MDINTQIQAGSDVATQATSASTTNTTENENSIDSLTNEFITLMVAQIQNQDPLDPADGTEYVSQLAQFSQVQSSENMVQLLQNNAIMLDNLQVLTTANLVGRDVAVVADEINADEVDKVEGYIELAASSTTVNLVFTDNTGQAATVALGSQSAGRVDFDVDFESLGLSGVQNVSVVIDEDQEYEPDVAMYANVDGVKISPTTGIAMLEIVGLGEIPYYDITYFGQ